MPRKSNAGPKATHRGGSLGPARQPGRTGLADMGNAIVQRLAIQAMHRAGEDIPAPVFPS